MRCVRRACPASGGGVGCDLIAVSRGIQDWESSYQRELINRGGDELAHLKAAIDEEFEVVYHAENPVTIHNMRSESDGNREAVPINNRRRVKMGMQEQNYETVVYYVSYKMKST